MTSKVILDSGGITQADTSRIQIGVKWSKIVRADAVEIDVEIVDTGRRQLLAPVADNRSVDGVPLAPSHPNCFIL